jgi:hypothetical protein
MISKETSLVRYDLFFTGKLGLISHMSFRPIKLWPRRQKRMTSSGWRKPLWSGSKRSNSQI